MESKKPDNVVFSKEQGYHASILNYSTNVGAPVIQTEDVAAWKQRGITAVNKQFESKFKELKAQYESLIKEFEWNEMIYQSKITFEPVIGEVYHLYRNHNGENFLSLIAPNEWNNEHLGTFQLNSDKKWILVQQ